MTLNRFILVFTTLIALALPPASLAAPTMLVTPEESAASDAAGGLLAQGLYRRLVHHALSLSHPI